MSTQVEKVNAIWDRIEKWFAENKPTEELPAGASPADIISLETHLGRAIPEELKASLLRHNGLDNISKGQLLAANEINPFNVNSMRILTFDLKKSKRNLGEKNTENFFAESKNC